MTTQFAAAKTTAATVAATMTVVELATLTGQIREVELSISTEIANAVKVSLCYLVADGTREPINELLSALSHGNRKAVESLIQWATVYKLDKVPVAMLGENSNDGQREAAKEAGKDTTLKAVTKKEKGRKDKKAEIEEGASANFNRFMAADGFNGNIWSWIESTDREAKANAKAERKAAKEAAEANKNQVQKYRDSEEKLAKLLEKSNFAPELRDQIMQLVGVKVAEMTIALAAAAPAQVEEEVGEE